MKPKQFFQTMLPPGHPAGKIRRMLTWIKVKKERRDFLKTRDWSQRVAVAVECPDNRRIPRVPEAGQRTGKWIAMHNGIQVAAGGYYGSHADELFRLNRGVHEPQEEYLFGEVIKQLPDNSTMFELGAYWGFYSMWFAREISGARCFLVEGDPANTEVGRENFERNKLSGTFYTAFLGSDDLPENKPVPRCSVDGLMCKYNLESLTMLHADIQGHELAMLEGASSTLASRKVAVLFISTHSDELHYKCKEFLESKGYLVPWSIDCIDSYSLDGVLVAHRPGAIKTDHIVPSLRSVPRIIP